ncbi:MAG: c(7)-type cytochrome triheme domain-containing protein [Bryobacteraceae bacterium]|jgi:c(7)-type cytochrome triheme protein
MDVRHTVAFLIAAALVGGAMAAAQDQKPPEKLVFPNKGGDAIFTHAAHIDREKGECTACHDKLWPQSTKEPLQSSDGCRTCHRAGGRAFEMKGNCVTCHPSSGGKSAAQ